MAIMPIAAVLERVLQSALIPSSAPATAWTVAFLSVVVAPIEEVAKYLVVRLRFYPDPEFNEPVDGIVYATTVGLGFATLENAVYMVRLGVQVVILRSLVSTLLHVSCAALVGYALGRAKFGSPTRATIGRALLASIGIHALFNVLLVAGSGWPPPAWAPAAPLLLIGLMVMVYRRVDREIVDSLKRSPFRPGRHRADSAPPGSGASPGPSRAPESDRNPDPPLFPSSGRDFK
ncbi:MAG: PrsW family intramembrane metalloprotease [Candidatus Riflebacteria bacterium]|nr:PrsW family intramembrane metalloprotease [Candidatus Riflebacteria bacterium]